MSSGMNTRIVPRDYPQNRPIIETTDGVYVRVSYYQTVEGAERDARRLDEVAAGLGVKTRYRVRGNHS